MREETRMATSEAARKLSEDKVPYLFLYGNGKSVDIIWTQFTPQASREYFEMMSETQVRGLPFIGSLQPWKIAPKKEEVKDENNW